MHDYPDPVVTAPELRFIRLFRCDGDDAGEQDGLGDPVEQVDLQGVFACCGWVQQDVVAFGSPEVDDARN